MTPPASVSVIARLDVPVFCFVNVPEDINPNRTNGLCRVFLIRVSLTTNIAVYVQAILDEHAVDTAFQVSNFNSFIGLSYVFGGAD